MFDRFDVWKVLVIAPLRVAHDTWSRECAKWDHLKHIRIAKVLGTEKQRLAALKENADIYITNRENTEWLVELFKGKWPFRMVVIDELSSFKNPQSRRFKALRKVIGLTKKVVGLTGTPAPNGLMDLWSQVYLLDLGERLGRTLTEYRTRYFSPAGGRGYHVYGWDIRAGAEDEIHRQISDICMSMSAEDWLELPERIDNEVYVRMPAEVVEEYAKLERDFIIEMERGGDIVASNAAVLTNKLLQFANGAIYDEHGETRELHEAKVKALEEIIEGQNGSPLLVYYNFRHDLERIQKYGRVLQTAKDIQDWNDGKIKVLLAHPASAGHGLNLQDGGHTICWFGLNWSLELYQQANARLHRQGQTKSVIIHHIITEGTIDEQVLEVLEGKATKQADLLAAVKAKIESKGG
jgi:SNF2 family DNA or RNA helicase